MVVVLAMGLRERVLFKISIRNIARRKGNTAIVIIGLMIGTAIISSSLAIGDTMANMVESQVLDSWGLVDEMIVGEDPMGGEEYFDEDVFDAVEAELGDWDRVDGLAPEIRDHVALNELSQELFEPAMMLFGVDHSRAGGFGDLVGRSGKTYDSIPQGQLLMAELSAEALEAEKGDQVLVMGTGGVFPFTIGDILRKEGRASGGTGIYVDLATAQDIVARPDQINRIIVSNDGDVESGMQHTDGVVDRIDGLKLNSTLRGPDLVNISLPAGGGIPDGAPPGSLPGGSGDTNASGQPGDTNASGQPGDTDVTGQSGDTNASGQPGDTDVTGAPGDTDVTGQSGEGDGTAGAGADGTDPSGAFDPASIMGVTEPVPGAVEIKVGSTKEDDVEESVSSVRMFTQLFLVFGTFSIIAGSMLIVNIFVMLGEERKSEMGIMRAVGMKRQHLTRGFIYEGTMYAAMAALVGTVVGVVIGWLVIFAIEEIFTGFSDVTFSIMQFYNISPRSLILAFSAGFLITMVTIALTSTRISRLNIVRAIRGLSEPPRDPKDRKISMWGGVMVALGILGTMAGWAVMDEALWHVGIGAALFGAGLALRYWVGERASLNIAGWSVLIFIFIPWSWKPDFGGEGMMMFIVAGIFMVGSAMTIVLANADQLINGLNIFAGRKGKNRAVAKVAISYPSASKFRTGMTMGMFALIIFTITMLSMMTGIFNANIEAQMEEMSGGYDVIGSTFSERPPAPGEIADLMEGGNGSRLDRDMIPEYSAPVGGYVSFEGTNLAGERDTDMQTLLGFEPEFFEERRFELAEWVDDYETEDDVWEAVRTDPGLILIDSALVPNDYGPPMAMVTIELGDTLDLKVPNGTVYPKKVVGILTTALISSMITTEDVAVEEFGFGASPKIFFVVGDGYDPDDVGRDIERSFLAFGLQTIVLETFVNDILKAQNQFFSLFNAYLGLGLIVGLAGLGIITLRAIRERRQQIGMLRAVGFTRSMVRRTFLIEATFIALSGIIIGILLGIALGAQMWYYEFRPEGMDVFTIPVVDLLMIVFVCLVATLLCTVPPAHQASKVTPAEALRYE